MELRDWVQIPIANVLLNSTSAILASIDQLSIHGSSILVTQFS